MATEEQIRQKDEKWANKSWKPFLWMAIGGTVSLIIGIVLLVVGMTMMVTTPDTQAVASMIAFTIFGYVLIIVGGLVLEGGIALIIVTMIKRNKARERLGLPKK